MFATVRVWLFASLVETALVLPPLQSCCFRFDILVEAFALLCKIFRLTRVTDNESYSRAGDEMMQEPNDVIAREASPTNRDESCVQLSDNPSFNRIVRCD